MSKCEDCKNYDSSERSAGRGYCTYYKEYRWPDSNVCGHFEGDSGGIGCYLTTACTKSKGLPDDCYELETLRRFRDTYMAFKPEGKTDIAEYYKFAPLIVEAIDNRSDSTEIWNRVYEEMILPCVRLIECEKSEEAYDKYKQFSLLLRDLYLK